MTARLWQEFSLLSSVEVIVVLQFLSEKNVGLSHVTHSLTLRLIVTHRQSVHTDLRQW